MSLGEAYADIGCTATFPYPERLAMPLVRLAWPVCHWTRLGNTGPCLSHKCLEAALASGSDRMSTKQVL